MEIQYWADIACPYCYMGITQLQRALKELKIADQTPLKFMSFQLDPTLPTTTDLSMTEYYAKAHQLTKQEALTQIQKIDQLAADIDLPIKMENAIPVNTLAAHRLIKYIESLNDQALLNKAVKRLYQLYFNDNESITDYEALTVAMNEIRLPVADVKKVLESNQYEDEVRKNERRAFMIGMPSAPLFVINNKYSITGALEEVPSSGNAMTRPIGNMAHIAGFALWTEHLRFFSRGHRFMEPLGFSRMIGKCESGPIYNSQYWPMNSFKDSLSSFAIRKRSSGVSRISSRLMQHSPHCVQ